MGKVQAGRKDHGDKISILEVAGQDRSLRVFADDHPLIADGQALHGGHEHALMGSGQAEDLGFVRAGRPDGLAVGIENHDGLDAGQVADLFQDLLE